MNSTTRPDLLLTHHTFVCLTDGVLVFLNLRNDQYACFERQYTMPIGKLLGLPVSSVEDLEPAVRPADDETVRTEVRKMIANGFATHDSKEGKRAEFITQPSELREMLGYEIGKAPKVRVGHVLNFFKALIVTKSLLRFASMERTVMRDPTGAFPCFYTPYRGVEIYFSDMQDIARFEFLRFTVNWEYLRTNLLLPQFQKIHTGLNEVGEVLPAECVEITPFERRSRFVWDPIKISETDVVEDIEAAASLLCSTVRNTVHALAGCYDSVVHNLGGLDSSILLACLAQAPKRPEIAAINYFTKSPRGDERRYARQAASKFGVELVEAELDYRKADLNRVFTSNKLVSPLGFFDCVALTGDVLGLARKKDAQALFYGVGGDNVYFQPSFNVGALDYVQRRGLLGGGLIRIAMEASRYGRISLLKTLAAMLRERFMPAPCWDYVHDLFFRNLRLPLIHPDFLAGDAAQFLHPLLRPNDHDLKGKYIHILMTSFFSIEYYDHWDTEYRAERIHAYLAQPIIEACLRIPVWVMTHGGVDRGLARKVFRDDLPRDVVGRLSKSTPETYYDDIYLNNVGFIREYLLDGVLVREGVLAHDKLEAALAMTSIQQQVIKFQILFYLGTEAWLRGCMEKPVQEAARLKSAT